MWLSFYLLLASSLNEGSLLLSQSTMSRHALDQFRCDPDNWKLGIFYFCRADPRIIVPKRIRGLGWTINFARPSAIVWAVFLSLFVWSTVALARYAGASHEALLILKVVLAFAILGFCYRAANASAATKP